MRRPMFRFLIAAIVLTGVNAGLVALYVYASAVVAQVTHESNVSRLVADGLLPVEAWNERLEQDGHAYRLRVSGDTAVGAIQLTRDYFLVPRHQQHITCARASVVLSLITLLLLGCAAWSASRARRSTAPQPLPPPR